MVTLDDLLADEAAPVADLADVVRAQIGEGGPMAPTKLEMQAARRRASRLDASSRAREVLEASVRTLDANVSAGQMQDVRHQLPKELRGVFARA